MLRALGQFAVQYAEVALQLVSLTRRAVVVAGVRHEDFGLPNTAFRRPAGADDGRQNLLVDPVIEAQVGPVPKELDVRYHGHFVGPVGRTRAVNVDGEPHNLWTGLRPTRVARN